MRIGICQRAISTIFLVVSVSAFAQQQNYVRLEDVWKPSASGVVIQVPASKTLIISPAASGQPYVLAGNRLVIRAANVRLDGETVIRAYPDKLTPSSPPAFSSTGDPGPDGNDGGGAGGSGKPGANGRTGDPGRPAGMMTLTIGEITGNGTVSFFAVGETGGPGQAGQEGGKGGKSGRGSDSAKSWPNCNYSGGDAGEPGDGGPGGLGGKGGTGGAGGLVRYTADISSRVIVIKDGAGPPTLVKGQVLIDVSGGNGGVPGKGGRGGDGGDGNDGGSGGGACGGGNAKGKKPRFPDQTSDLGVGNRGLNGGTSITQ